LSEVIIPIDTFNPVEFFGVNDSNLEVIRKNFPELKLVARGNEDGYLEIALNRASASGLLGIKIMDSIRIQFYD